MGYGYMNARFNILLLSFICLVVAGCKSPVNPAKLESPPGFRMDQANQVKLPLELDEVSGLAYFPGDSSLFAITDEKGHLYKLKKGQEIQHWKFGKGEDFEDLVLLDSIFYVLESTGNIIRLSFNSENTLAVQRFSFDVAGDTKNEFEILYYDTSKLKMILICKDCETDKKKSLTTFTFDPATGKYSDQSFSIDVKEIAHSVGEEKMKFKPSAASINPRDGLLYIISSINKLIVTTDLNGKFINAYRIDPQIFKQPEGLTFTPQGDMIISNESADIGVADILFFTYYNK